MRKLVRPWVGLGLALLLAGAPDALADKKDKKDKGKKAAGASVTVTFTADQRGAAQGWYVDTGYLYVTLDGDLLKLAVGTLLVVDAIDGLLN